MKNKSQRKGFTIIEVVLVLAIAGLIFLMVFVALPALQRSQRDTQRRNDMSRFSSQLTQYQSNNGGNVPSETSKDDWNNIFIANYLRVAGDEYKDPNGEEYVVDEVLKCTSSTDCTQQSETDDFKGGKIKVYTHASCDGEKPQYEASGSRKVAFTYKLEGAGVYCGNN